MIPKFRAWHKKEKKMYDVLVLAPSHSVMVDSRLKSREGFTREFKWKEIILLQFTGAKDKNGREIFEGDIVKHKNGYVYAVEKPLSPNLWWSLCPRKDTPTGGLKGQEMRLHMCEVIGNKLENPELLKEKVK